MSQLKPVLIVSCTKETKEKTTLYKSLERYNKTTVPQTGFTSKFNVKFIENNNQSLSVNYNKFIDKKFLKKHDIILFIHDDVYIDDLECFSKLYSYIYEYKYDIVGVAGGSDVQVKKPALWHLMSKNRFGYISHPSGDDISEPNLRTIASFGPTPKRCLVVDGVFIGLNLARAIDTGWRFNESYDFHHYDLSSCIDANKLKLKIGVAPINILHNSPGLKDYWDENYQQSERKFINEYGSK